MPGYFLDTSALAKHYHPETGTARVDALLAEAGSSHFISRLGAVELLSVFAGKVRTEDVATGDVLLLRKRFQADVTGGLLRPVRMRAAHFQGAERLLLSYGPAQSIRTLDALQLAVASDLRSRGFIDHFVCADRRLLAVATAEGLAVIDPEHP
jgi:predicted nucleic acid-binding protein